MIDTSSEIGKIESDKATKIFIELGGSGYWNKYGTHVLTSLIIIVIILLLYSYVTLSGQITYFKYGKDKDGKPVWNREKCKPHILPISGHLNPEPGYSASESTMRNFKNCASDIFKNESAPAFNPITIFINAVTLLLKSFMNILINIRKAIQGIFDAIISKFKANKRLVVNTQNEVTTVVTNDIYYRLNNSIHELNNSVKRWTVDDGNGGDGDLLKMIKLADKAKDFQVIQYYIDYFDIIGLQSIGKAQGAGGKSSNSQQISRTADSTSGEVAIRKYHLHRRYKALSDHYMPVLPVYANSGNSYKVDKLFALFYGNEKDYGAGEEGKEQRAQRQITNGQSVSRENLPTGHDEWQILKPKKVLI
jgi:hypothetical protein